MFYRMKEKKSEQLQIDKLINKSRFSKLLSLHHVEICIDFLFDHLGE